jgi:hypothetical protein
MDFPGMSDRVSRNRRKKNGKKIDILSLPQQTYPSSPGFHNRFSNAVEEQGYP